MSNLRPLSIIERHGLSIALLSSYSGKNITWLTALLQGNNKLPGYQKHLDYSFMRSLNSKLNPAQLQSLHPPTEAAYLSFASIKGFEPQTSSLEDGTKAHWLGSSTADHVIFFLHGGGFIYPASTAQFELLWSIKNNIQSGTKDVGVVFLSYTLAPYAQYPTQLRQAVSLLKYLVETLRKDPSKITLFGDSAGGNLAIGVLSHILHPHQEVPSITLEKALGGCLLISPWVSFSTTAPSYQNNKYKDCLGIPELNTWSSAWQGDAPRDPYNQPLHASSQWWEGLSSIVDEIFVVAGADEVFADDIKAWAEVVRQLHPHRIIKLLVTEDEAHDQPIMDLIMGYTEDGEQASLVKGWFMSKVSNMHGTPTQEGQGGQELE